VALAILNPELFVDEDASVSFEMGVKDLSVPLQALGYQFKWDAGVAGTITFMASIFPSPYNWEALVSCEEVTFHTSESPVARTMILSIPGVWFSAAFLKFVFVPDVGSTGDMSVAERVAPL